jgi:hypothetical protein
MTVSSPLDGFAEAAGRVLAQARREWRAERELAQAEYRRSLAELEARVANLTLQVREMVAERLAVVRDGADGKDGEPGRDVDLVVVENLVNVAVEREVAKIPAPKDGVDGKDGEPGRSVDLEEVKTFVATEVEQAVKSLPVPADGHTPTEEELAPLIDTVVSSAIAALPRPKDGEDGKSVDPGEVERLVAEAVAKLPPAERGEAGPPGESIVGEKGEKGDAGPVGPPPDEDLVARLVDEAVGRLPPAERGEVGPEGPRGEKGDPGESIKGDPGERGPEGPAGKLPIVKAWRRGVHYEGDVRAHEGSTYQALRDTAEEPPHEDWIAIAARGETPYVGEVCGLYKADGQYRKFDIVVQNGAEWRAKKDDPGLLPGDGWALSAQKGERGNKGERGDLGPRGPVGQAAPRIKEWLTKDYQAIPVLDDGTLGPALDVREFFELYDGETR